MYFMIPWVTLGFLLAFGLLISIIVTSVNFFKEDDNFNGGMCLGIGLVSLGNKSI